MKFELNDYHRNVSDEELIKDILYVATCLNKESLTTVEYSSLGKYNVSTITRRLGSWNKALEQAGLHIAKSYTHNVNNENISNDELIDDLLCVANTLNKRIITTAEYRRNGHHGISIFQSRFGTWENALSLAGLTVAHHHNYSDEELLQEIERVWILLGRQPTSTDIKNGISKYSLQSYSRRFGGWRGALQAFVDWVDTDDGTETEQENREDNPVVSDIKAEPKKNDIRTRTTSRDINLRLRFRVMKRDNFKCCICGASPAKDPAVELHIDHIIPWSKGGETVMDNLQTLCSKCNLGKSDLV